MFVQMRAKVLPKYFLKITHRKGKNLKFVLNFLHWFFVIIRVKSIFATIALKIKFATISLNYNEKRVTQLENLKQKQKQNLSIFWNAIIIVVLPSNVVNQIS